MIPVIWKPFHLPPKNRDNNHLLYAFELTNQEASWWFLRQDRLLRPCRPSSSRHWEASRKRGCAGERPAGLMRLILRVQARLGWRHRKTENSLQCGDSPKKLLGLTLPPGGLSWEWFIKTENHWGVLASDQNLIKSQTHQQQTPMALAGSVTRSRWWIFGASNPLAPTISGRKKKKRIKGR